jgi:adenylate cyclase
VSETVVAQCDLDIFRPMGDVVLRGRASKLGIYEPVPGMAADTRKAISELATKAIAGDAAALQALEHKSETMPEDKALTNLVYRLKHQEEGGYFVLD